MISALRRLPPLFRSSLMLAALVATPLPAALGKAANVPDAVPDPGPGPTNLQNPPPPDEAGIKPPAPLLPPGTLSPQGIPPESTSAVNPTGGAPVPGTPDEISPPTVKPAPTPDTTVPDVGPSDPGLQIGREEPGGNFRLESPEGVIHNGPRGLYVARGDVTFRYRDFVVRGQHGVFDENKNLATLSGDLTVTTRGRTFTGQSLTFDVVSGEWKLSQLARVIPPEEFPTGSVLQPLYFEGGLVTGRDEDVLGENFQFTSCDRDHYYLRSRRVDFYRDQTGEYSRIVLRKNALYVLDRKIVPLPVYVVSLNGQRSRRYGLQPTFGQNSFDGVFVKTLYDLSATESRTDSLLIDLLQKRGLGLGFQRELAEGAGLLYLYALSGKQGGRQIDSRIRRNWNITPGLISTLNFQSTKNSSEQAEGFSSRNADWSLAYTTPRVQSNLLLRYANNQSGVSSFDDFGATLQHKQEFGKGYSIDASSLYARSNSQGVVSSATLDNAATLARRRASFDTFLRAELHDDLTGTNQRNGAYQLERIPELSLVSDTGRLKIPYLNTYLPGDLAFKIGRFNEPATTELSRTDMVYGARPRTIKLLKVGLLNSEITGAGRFEQAFYSNDTARYNYDYTLNLNNTLGPLSFQANYYKQRTFGYTPFQFDFLTPSESLDLTASFQPGPKLRVNVSSGRDLQNSFSRDIIARVQLAPTPSVYASLGASYSPETNAFGDIIGNFRFARNPDKFLGGSLDLGVRYSSQTNELARINAAADLYVTKKIRVQALSSYSGFTKTFDLNQIRIAHDLHCFNLFTTYDQQRKQVRFDLALKAFPFLDTRFGQGQLGEGFDPFVGDVQ